jgi:Sigma 54 modulation/S30EA ribosomal protein C terminus
MSRRLLLTTTDVRVVTRGPLPAQAVDYVREKIIELGLDSEEPVRRARVRLTHPSYPAVSRPVRAEGLLDVDGRMLRARVAAASPGQAADLLRDRLRHRLSCLARSARARRAGKPVPGPDEWCHPTDEAHRPEYYARPVGQREIVRDKAYPLPLLDADGAAFEMECLDYDFHLFIERGTGQDAVLYRTVPPGYRLAALLPVVPPVATPLVAPEPGTATAVTVNPRPVPWLANREAVRRLDLTGEPFLFFGHAADRRGRVLYRRTDGHYGLIRPATTTGAGR